MGFEPHEQLQRICIFHCLVWFVFPLFFICTVRHLSVDHTFNIGSSDTLELYRASKNGYQIAVMTTVPMNDSFLEHEKL